MYGPSARYSYLVIERPAAVVEKGCQFRCRPSHLTAVQNYEDSVGDRQAARAAATFKLWNERHSNFYDLLSRFARSTDPWFYGLLTGHSGHLNTGTNKENAPSQKYASPLTTIRPYIVGESEQVWFKSSATNIKDKEQ
ncbi:hypothetical protein AVEN_115879-1 [Araneus ventricosus]|uniref:Uncharacterized protein n=1 Tax=Araneus ventricosus TaxID=182803 RepID=A0A4Y2QPJ5_ARAVE|nr:hypothetical protein AVEN_115879-1 [Araneus ventricosus]